jgi:hypothetical protein
MGQDVDNIKMDLKVNASWDCVEFIWLKAGTSSELFFIWHWKILLYQRREISWLDDCLFSVKTGECKIWGFHRNVARVSKFVECDALSLEDLIFRSTVLQSKISILVELPNLEYVDNNILRSAGNYLPKDTASHPRRLDTSVKYTCSLSCKVHEYTKVIYWT